MAIETKMTLDKTDKNILRALSDDARISMRDLAAIINMSPPSTADRVKRLIDIGIIQKFTVDLNLRKLGYMFEAMMLITPHSGRFDKIEAIIKNTPTCIECDKVSGDACYIARFVFASVDEMDKATESLSGLARTQTSIVKSKAVTRQSLP